LINHPDSSAISFGNTHWVGDDANVGFWAVFGACLGQITDNGGIGVEKICCQLARCILNDGQIIQLNLPSRVMPGFLGTPAGIMTISAPLRQSLRSDGVWSYPVTLLLVLI